ncbi:hypothetical protein [Dactylosporangium sp. CS-033363]|uniref:hypothetical protein n=1 Tax=Dactylosporangium sp. CS-033363 TaxID=3239935 RepID=UPI003D8DB606
MLILSDAGVCGASGKMRLDVPRRGVGGVARNAAGWRMATEKMLVEWEDGARLTQSAKKPGSFSALTRNGATNDLGQVTFRAIDGERTALGNFVHDVAVQVAAQVAVALAEKAWETAKPHVDTWVTETAVPAATSAVASAGSAVGSAAVSIGSAVASVGSVVGTAAVQAGSAVGSAAVSAGSAVGSAAVAAGSAVAAAGSAVGSTASSAWNWLTRNEGKPVVELESYTAVEAGVVVEVTPVDASHDVAAAVEAYRAGMSRAEAQQRIVAALAARLFSEQQIAIVRNARITDGGDTPELDSAALASTQQQIGESLQLILETATTLLGEDAMADLRNMLGSALAEEDGQLERRI